MFIGHALDVQLVDEWLDENTAQEYKEQPLAQDWARIGKVIEELGETITALIAYTGQNPRKGIYGTEWEMLDEFADTLITCILGMQHFTKDTDLTALIILDRWDYRKAKIGMSL